MRFGSPSLKHVKSDLSTSNVSEIINFNVYHYFLVYVSIYFDIYLFVNTHVRIKIYREFYHCIIYIANEGHLFLLMKHTTYCII
jgi:hypothetical protein